MKRIIILLSFSIFLLMSLCAHLFFDIPSNLESVMQSPSWGHLLGTDSLGRDLALRSLQAFGTSFLVGGFSLLVALVVGIIVGGCAAWFGSYVDIALMRLLDFMDGLPDLLVAIALILALQAILGTEYSFLILALALGLSSWMRLARQTRALMLQEKAKLYSLASQSLGASPFRILTFHLLPNIRRPLLRFSVMHLPGFILFEGSLSFFGLGLKPPHASLGLLLHEGWRTISLAPHLVWVPACLLFLTLLAFEQLISADPVS